MSMMQGIRMKNPAHPGGFVKGEINEALGLSVTQAAPQLVAARVSALCPERRCGRTPLSPRAMCSGFRYIVAQCLVVSLICTACNRLPEIPPEQAEKLPFATKQQIANQIVGHSVRRDDGEVLTIAPDGSYTMNGPAGPYHGNYIMSDGRFCYKYTSASKTHEMKERCVEIRIDNTKLIFKAIPISIADSNIAWRPWEID